MISPVLLNIYKPAGITSHDVVDRVRKATGEKRVGHAGTLDPFAEGVLVVGTGKDTKLLGGISKGTDKEYVAGLTLGAKSSTGDPEGEITKAGNANVSEQRFQEVLRRFTGKITQTPPQHSAVKVRGKRAYEYARKGEAVRLPERRVTIHGIDLVSFAPPEAVIRVVSSSGTYIRSLARDIGEELGTGAYLASLVRTRVGEWGIKDSVSLDKVLETYNTARTRNQQEG